MTCYFLCSVLHSSSLYVEYLKRSDEFDQLLCFIGESVIWNSIRMMEEITAFECEVCIFTMKNCSIQTFIHFVTCFILLYIVNCFQVSIKGDLNCHAASCNENVGYNWTQNSEIFILVESVTDNGTDSSVRKQYYFTKGCHSYLILSSCNVSQTVWLPKIRHCTGSATSQLECQVNLTHKCYSVDKDFKLSAQKMNKPNVDTFMVKTQTSVWPDLHFQHLKFEFLIFLLKGVQ